jgi:erythromycin esterase-like protein
MPVKLGAESIESIRVAACPLRRDLADFDPLLELIGDAHYVLLGEASHGTHEFYKARAEISKRLVLEKGFTIIAWEADWPDALRVNRYVRVRSQDRSAMESLSVMPMSLISLGGCAPTMRAFLPRLRKSAFTAWTFTVCIARSTP